MLMRLPCGFNGGFVAMQRIWLTFTEMRRRAVQTRNTDGTENISIYSNLIDTLYCNTGEYTSQ